MKKGYISVVFGVTACAVIFTILFIATYKHHKKVPTCQETKPLTSEACKGGHPFVFYQQDNKTLAPWLSGRDAGIIVQQADFFRGYTDKTKITLGGASVDYGAGSERMPFRFAVRTAGRPLLFWQRIRGPEMDYAITSVAAEGDRVTEERELSMHTSSVRVNANGFVFKKGENPVSSVGIILPDWSSPEEESNCPYTLTFSGRGEEELSRLKELGSYEKLTGEHVLAQCSNYLQRDKDKPVRVLWFKIDPVSGRLKLEKLPQAEAGKSQ